MSTLPQGLTAEGLFTVNPTLGAADVNFASDINSHSTDEKNNLQKVREYADKFAAESRQPDSEIARKISEDLAGLESTKDLRRQQELVDRLRRERDEAQAAIK